MIKPRRNGGQQAPPALVRGEHRAGSQPRVQIEAAALAAAREEFHEAAAGHEERRADADPQQHHDRKPQHLPERKQAIFKQPENVQPRLHNDDSAPRVIDAPTNDTSQAGMRGGDAPLSARFNAIADCQPCATVGNTATMIPIANTATSPSSCNSGGAKAAVRNERYADAIGRAAPLAIAIGCGRPCA